MDTDGRSPIKPRQLHDLRLMPTATDPRPAFFWSAEGNRDLAVTHSLYPKLLWHGTTNVEITVHSAEEETAKLREGYVLLPISAVVVDPVQNIADQLAGLPEEEKALILQAQATIRRNALIDKLAQLSDDDIEKLAASTTKPKKTKVA